MAAEELPIVPCQLAKRRIKTGLALAALFLSTGCGSIRQETKPVSISASERREICVIEDPSVREDFLEAYKTDLSQKGFTVRVLPKATPVAACPVTSTYEANWRWDLALYLVYANLKVYRSGRLEGQALYDATGAKLRTDKFVDASKKLQELTDQLFSS